MDVSERRCGNIEEDKEQSENLSVDFLRKKRNLGTTDADYVMNTDFSVLCDENGDDIDPDYKLFLSRLKKDGSSYILGADERIGLTQPLKYEEDEDQSDSDYAFFIDMCFQYDSDHSVIYDCQHFPSPPKNDNVDGSSSRKQMSNRSLHSKKSSSTSEEGKEVL